MDKYNETAEWIPDMVDDEVVSYHCSNCYEEEGPDAVRKYSRCPNCNYRMVNGHEQVS